MVGDWGYAIKTKDCVYIPAFMCRLRPLLDMLYEKTGMKKIIFTAVLDPEKLKPHLKNIKREWDEWVDYMEDYSHCIEIEYVKEVET